MYEAWGCNLEYGEDKKIETDLRKIRDDEEKD
jgi:hypothetical protein